MKPNSLSYASIENTPLGIISVGVSDQGVAELVFNAPAAPAFPAMGLLRDALVQIEEYLQGKRKIFDLPIDWTRMPAFQKAVLQLTNAIPYGEILTYQQIANTLGKPGAARAVGQAEAKNPIPLIIPCHRVVGTDGRMHGYGGRGGIPTKVWLLKMEGHKFPDEQLSLF